MKLNLTEWATQTLFYITTAVKFKGRSESRHHGRIQAEVRGKGFKRWMLQEKGDTEPKEMIKPLDCTIEIQERDWEYFKKNLVEKILTEGEGLSGSHAQGMNDLLDAVDMADEMAKVPPTPSACAKASAQ